MTANELADYLCNTEIRIPNHNEIKAANLLRQQQSEIKELKRQVEDRMGRETYQHCLDTIRQQQAEIKELKLARLADLDVILKQRAEIESLFKEIPEFEKVFSNEPVAYGKYLEEHDYWVTASGIIPNPKEGYVPLYTHPAKTLTPLTDDECEAIINRHDWFSKSWREMAKEIHDAILRKAQEKCTK